MEKYLEKGKTVDGIKAMVGKSLKPAPFFFFPVHEVSYHVGYSNSTEIMHLRCGPQEPLMGDI